MLSFPTPEIIDGTIGPEEARRRNEELRRDVQGQLLTFGEQVVELTAANQDDPPMVADMKQAVARAVFHLMSSLLLRFLVDAQKVYECFHKGIKWCYDKMKDLVSGLVRKVESYF